MFYSQFVAHYTANVGRMPAAIAVQIKRDAQARIIGRQRAGRADGALLFDDLIERIEFAICGEKIR